MKAVLASVLALAAAVTAAPQQEKRQATACASAVSLSGNPFASRTLHPNPFYKDEITEAITQMTDESMKAKALKVAEVGSFLWM